jgi:hypothetical protein
MNHLNQIDKAMSPEQFTQVVDAILEGKYSWACVLILRFAGYNPLHYIPYRTYNRLMKDHSQARENDRQNTTNYSVEKYPINTISDLNFLETIEEDCPHVQGGRSPDMLVEHCWELMIQPWERVNVSLKERLNTCQTGNLQR